jgi:Zn-dependent oligopeptidase
MEKLAILENEFALNVLKDESDVTVELGINDLSGLPSDLSKAANDAAIDKKLDRDRCGIYLYIYLSIYLSRYIITLSRSLVVPFLTFSGIYLLLYLSIILSLYHSIYPQI